MTAGPLTRLLAGLGLDDKLPPIETPKRIEVMPVTVGVPVGRDTPKDCRCPCGIFEKEAHAELCPKCTLKQANRQRAEREKLSRADSIDRELSEREAMRNRAERQVVRDANMIDRMAHKPEDTQ